MFIIYTGDYMNNCHCNQIDILKCIVIEITIIFLMVFIVVIIIFNNDNVEKDILTAIAVQGDNTQLGTTTIKFSQNDIVVGNALTHEEGSDIISINETGIYQISYQLFGINNSPENTFNFNAVILINGSPLNSTLNSSPALRDNVNNRMTLTSTVILSLNAGDIVQLGGLSLENIVYQDSRMDIVKIQ